MAQTGLAPNFNFRHTDANPVIMKRVDLDFDAVDFADELGCDRIFVLLAYPNVCNSALALYQFSSCIAPQKI